MKRLIPTSLVFLSLGMFLQSGSASSQGSPVGLFEAHGDIGAVGKPGSVEYDAARKSYLVGGGGENMWLANDAFHFVWTKASGVVSLAADLRWMGAGG
jgi:TolB protein